MMQSFTLLLLLGAVTCQVNQNDPNQVALLQSIFGTPSSSTSGPLTSKPLEDKNLGPATASPPFNNNDNEVQPQECNLPDGRKGECVNFYLCNANNTIVKDGAGVIDIRAGDGDCASYLEMCCDIGEKRPPSDPVTPTPKPDAPQREGCGWSNPNGADLQTTGDVNGETKFGEFPWACALLKVSPVNEQNPEMKQLNVYIGAGSLIHPSVVLTAAHYVAKENEMHVRAGEWDTQTIKEIYPFQDRDVESIVVHKDFNSGNLFYDVALLFVAQPFDMMPNVGVVCLPPPRSSAEPGTRCVATGWGKDKFGKEGRYQIILKKVTVPVVDDKRCQQLLRNTRLGKYFELHSSFMCAGGEAGVDACRGDGGAPLSCPIEFQPDRYVQRGIVAWGIGCATVDVPGVYVDVANLRDWIDDKARGKGHELTDYKY